MLNAKQMVNRLNQGKKVNAKDPFAITPLLKRIEKSGSASIDLRLGTWFVTLRPARMPCLKVEEDEKNGNSSPSQFTKTSYIPFGEKYYLHPRGFVLGITLEWLCMPRDLAGYLIGRSSWGRRGLIIATATGVHPGFKGCLTLELSNVGEIPIELEPGMEVCQLFIHKIQGRPPKEIDHSQFFGLRKPVPGNVKPDEIAKILAKASKP